MAVKKTRKTPARKRSARKQTAVQAETGLPRTVAECSRRLRQGLTRLERQIETARRDVVRSWTRVLRDVSHELGRLEELGEREWRLSNQARLEALQAVQKLDDTLAPPAKKRTPRKKARTKAKTGVRTRSQPRDRARS